MVMICIQPRVLKLLRDIGVFFFSSCRIFLMCTLFQIFNLRFLQNHAGTRHVFGSTRTKLLYSDIIERIIYTSYYQSHVPAKVRGCF